MDTYHSIQAQDTGPDRGGGSELRVYKRRWYVLIMYSMYAFTQSAVWNTWGPISSSSEDAFGWHDSTIAWLTNWGPVSYVLTGLLYPWLLQVKGLRWATLSSMFFVAAGSSLRVITSEPRTATILIHIGQFLNGVGGPISTGSIPALSATWFPPNERVTATALSNSINNLGSALTFILGPALVSTQPNVSSTVSTLSHSVLLGSLYSDHSLLLEVDNTTLARQMKEREQIMHYMYYACGWSVLLFLIMLCYFPAKPHHPPCVSATMERPEYWTGLWSLRMKGHFLIITLSYGISTGVIVVWASVININLKTVCVDEVTSGWIGFYSTLAGCVASLLVGRFADWFVHYMKLYILIMYIIATIALIIFALMIINVIPSSLAGYYVTIIVANALVNAAVPLMYELACELAFPTSEAAANGLLTFFNNFWGLVFLAIFSIPKVGTMWMNWTVIGSTAVCIPLIALIKGRFNRLEVDEGLHTQDYTEQEVVVPQMNGFLNPMLEDENVHTNIYAGKGDPPPYSATVPNSYSATAPSFYSVTVPSSYSGTAPSFYSATVPSSYSATAPSFYSATVPSPYSTTTHNLYGNHNSLHTDDTGLLDIDAQLDMNSSEEYGIQEPLLPDK